MSMWGILAAKDGHSCSYSMWVLTFESAAFNILNYGQKAIVSHVFERLDITHQ